MKGIIFKKSPPPTTAFSYKKPFSIIFDLYAYPYPISPILLNGLLLPFFIFLQMNYDLFCLNLD